MEYGQLFQNININGKLIGETGIYREIIFLKYLCTGLPYKEITEKIYLGSRTTGGYRDDLFQKLNKKTRIGLVMYALKNGTSEYNILP